MGEFAEIISKLIDSVNARFLDSDKHVLAIYQHCNMHAAAMLEYKKAILDLQRQVKELQNNAAEKILLEEPSENKTSPFLEPGNEYRANTNDR